MWHEGEANAPARAFRGHRERKLQGREPWLAGGAGGFRHVPSAMSAAMAGRLAGRRVRPAEERLALFGRRAGKWVALEYLFAHGVRLGRHQAQRLQQRGIGPRHAARFQQEYPAIEGAMFGTNRRRPDIGVEMGAGDIAQTYGQVRKFRDLAAVVRIGDETIRVDDNLSPRDFGLQ